MSYISRKQSIQRRRLLGKAAREIAEQGSGLAEFALIDLGDPVALFALKPTLRQAVFGWANAIQNGHCALCLLCDDAEFTADGEHYPRAVAITHPAGVKHGSMPILVNAICPSCASRADLIDATLDKLSELWPGLRTVDRAAVHLDGGSA